MPKPKEEFVSFHYLRRQARAVERQLEREEPGNQYRVARYRGGRFRFAVKRRIEDPEDGS